MAILLCVVSATTFASAKEKVEERRQELDDTIDKDDHVELDDETILLDEEDLEEDEINVAADPVKYKYLYDASDIR